jgi:hypothetical protein
VALLVRLALPVLDAELVDVLAAGDAVCDILGRGVQVVVADAAHVGGAAGREEFAVLLELLFEEGGGKADEVFVHGEAPGEVGDFEAYDFAADAVLDVLAVVTDQG